MSAHHSSLVKELSMGKLRKKTVSRSHLPIIIEQSNGASLAKLLYEYYGVSLSEKRRNGLHFDCKELKGSILAGRQ
ncbi:MAG: hypothetical protein H6554_10260 [Chitinophagales bacterium]|nr:hypothetical protein [Chitinophagales bacterium]